MKQKAFDQAPAPISLDGIWEFRFEEGKSIEEAADPGFGAAGAMTVPGCFDTMPEWYLKRGTALYRRVFTLPEPVANAWLVVDGMGLRGDFRIDGRPLGVRPFPYARLELETGPLAAGRHEVFAALDNRFDWATMRLARPYYDFYFHGGFYHGVSLVFDNRRLVVRTRDYRTGTVEIEAERFAERDFAATLLFDGRNEVAAEFRDGRATVRVPDFRLWSPDSPNLHTVAVKPATNHSSPTTNHHSPTTKFGIRRIEARDRRIWLNGLPVFLKGVNRHDTGADCGPATTPAQMLRDLQLLKSIGANFVRGAHYQQSPQFLDLCDALGVMVWEESLGWGNGQKYTMSGDGIDELADPVFREQQVAQTRAMVRASVNHPCVVISAFLNECESGRPECASLVRELASAVRAEDAGHLVTFACNRWLGDLAGEFTDIAAFNTYPGTIPAYPGLPAELDEKVHRNDPDIDQGASGIDVIARRFRERFPDKPIMLSECGVGALRGLRDPAAGFMSEDFQEEYIRDVLETVEANPDICGYAIWQMNDNRTYHRNSPGHPAKQMAGWSIAGIFDRHRQPKLAAETVRRHFRDLAARR